MPIEMIICQDGKARARAWTFESRHGSLKIIPLKNNRYGFFHESSWLDTFQNPQDAASHISEGDTASPDNLEDMDWGCPDDLDSWVEHRISLSIVFGSIDAARYALRRQIRPEQID